MKEQSKYNILKIGLLGGVGGLSLFLILSFLPYSDYISGGIFGLLFIIVLLAPYNDGIELSSVSTIFKNPKSIGYLVTSVIICILVTQILIKVIPRYGLLSLELLKGVNIAGFILGVTSFIIFNLKGRFDFPKWINIASKKATLTESNLKKYNFEIQAEFPNKCICCSEDSETTVDMKFERSSNIWAQIFSKGKKVEPLKIPYCSKHASEAKLNKRILFFAYFVPAAYIIFTNYKSNNDFFNLLALIVCTHFLSVFIQLGVKVILTPFLNSIKMMPIYNIFAVSGLIGRLLGIKVKDYPSDKTIEFQFSNSIIASEFENANS